MDAAVPKETYKKVKSITILHLPKKAYKIRHSKSHHQIRVFIESGEQILLHSWSRTTTTSSSSKVTFPKNLILNWIFIRARKWNDSNV